MSCLAPGGAADYNAPHGAVPKWLREQSAKLRCSGSNPLGASKVSVKVFFLAQPWFKEEGLYIKRSRR